MPDKQVNISTYLDSTFLKNSSELGVSNLELEILVTAIINEAIDYEFKCIMIRPMFVSLAKQIKDQRKSKINIGTVVDFPLGINSVNIKLKEAPKTYINRATCCYFELIQIGFFKPIDYESS